MKRIWLMVLPFYLFGQGVGLKQFIANASTTNAQLRAKEITMQSKQEQIEVAKSDYWPTVDIGGDYSLLTPAYVVSPGQVGNLYGSITMELYDGGRKDAITRSRSYEYEASMFEKDAFEKSITLDIVRHYYTIYALKATLQALQERQRELKAQINRVKKFFGAGLSTQEDVDKLISVYENNNYTIENTKLSLETSEDNLALITGLALRGMKENHFREPRGVRFEYFDAIKVMESNANAIEQSATAIGAGYMPQVNISDSYTQSHFDDFVSSGGIGGDSFLVEHQNRLSVSVSMRIFDNKKISKEKQSVQYERLALLSQIEYAKKEQKMHFKLAKKTLNTTQTKLKSAKSALKASESTYSVIRDKFEVGLVDNITFLDALATKILAQSRYKETLYDYEIKKSIYYYYAGKDPKEFIR